MNQSEAIVSCVYPYDVDPSLIEKLCIDHYVDPLEEYSASDKEKVARVAIDVLRCLISLSSENNQGYSLSYNVDKLKDRIHTIAKFNGFTDIAEEFNVKPKVFIEN